MFKRTVKPTREKKNTERILNNMKAQELAKYLPYADLNEDFVLIKKTTYLKICKLVKKYRKIKEILTNK